MLHSRIWTDTNSFTGFRHPCPKVHRRWNGDEDLTSSFYVKLLTDRQTYRQPPGKTSILLGTGDQVVTLAWELAKWKKRSEETQTLRAGCSKAELKNFAPPQTPFPGTRDGQNLISWRWPLPLPTDPVWWRSMHEISSYRGNRPTNTPTDRTDYNTLRRSLARSVKKRNSSDQRKHLEWH